MSSPPSTNSRQLYLRLLTYVRPYSRVFVLAMLCMGLSSLIEPAFPALMKVLLDEGFVKNQGNMDWLIYPLGILAVFLVRAILGFIGDYAMSWVSNNVIAELRLAMFDRLLKLPSSYYGDAQSGRLMSKIAYDVNGVAVAATSAITTLVKDSLSVVGLLLWLLYLNWQLTLITISIIPMIALVVKGFGGRLRKISRGIQESQGTITQVLQEAIEGQKVVKIFGGQTYESERFLSAVKEQRGLAMRNTIAAAAQGPIVQFFAAVALAVIMGVALTQAANAETTAGSFVSFMTAMLMLMAPLKRLADINAPLQRGLAAAESVFSMIDEKMENDSGTVKLGTATGLVEFDNVTFTYPGVEQPALKDLSFAIRPGTSVALVGPSGSGKTTVANLLPRFYAVDSGCIRVDGHALETIVLSDLRANIAFVSQEVVLFNDSIAANIAYGSSRSREEIVQAAQAAQAMEFIDRLPHGFDTLVGEKGVKLSGGQRQRIAIARALLKNAPILILDEATSALDTESESLVQAALDRLMVGRATLIIAHRLSTIERASKILVLTNGKKAEEGTHQELLARNGVYARLYQIQQINSAELA
jgi:ATP-binding cassette, subfamily B, bacterial MsbA